MFAGPAGWLSPYWVVEIYEGISTDWLPASYLDKQRFRPGLELLNSIKPLKLRAKSCWKGEGKESQLSKQVQYENRVNP